MKWLKGDKLKYQNWQLRIRGKKKLQKKKSKIQVLLAENDSSICKV